MLHDLNEIEPSNDLHGDGNRRCVFLGTDGNGRTIYLTKVVDAQLAGNAAFYPDVSIHSKCDDRFYLPIKEKIMSLSSVVQTYTAPSTQIIQCIQNTPVFFFIYNTDNYYHFIYDALPYLISFQKLRRKVPDVQLLMNYPNSQTKTFYKFVTEFLEFLNITSDNIVLADMQTQYSVMYVSSSYTHDNNSDAAPRSEIYDFYQKIVRYHRQYLTGTGPRRIYISRRTWLHNNFSNIGTNYTMRRRLENEDALVDILGQNGFEEIFTENLSTLEKIDIFANADYVVGALGGGVCNVLFSPTRTKLLCLASPSFLDVNARFVYSFSHVNVILFHDTMHVEPGKFKRFMRVACPTRGIVGEITHIDHDYLEILYSKENVAGWNAQNKFESISLHRDECTPLDAGLNSAWRINLDTFSTALHSFL